MTTPLSDFERIKAGSRHLRGTIAEGLGDPVTNAISDDDNKLLKFYGSYLQDDRDLREERRKQKLEPAYSFHAACAPAFGRGDADAVAGVRPAGS